MLLTTIARRAGSFLVLVLTCTGCKTRQPSSMPTEVDKQAICVLICRDILTRQSGKLAIDDAPVLDVKKLEGMVIPAADASATSMSHERAVDETHIRMRLLESTDNSVRMGVLLYRGPLGATSFYYELRLINRQWKIIARTIGAVS